MSTEAAPRIVELDETEALRIENAILKMQRAEQEWQRLQQIARFQICQSLETREISQALQPQYRVEINADNGVRRLVFVEDGQQAG